MRRMVLFLIAGVLLFAGAAGAQTNLGIVGGILVPMADLSDRADLSPYIGARWEIQDVSPMGPAVVLSFLIQGGFAFLQTDKDLEAVLDALGQSDDGTYFDIGAGVRVYSTASPLFISAGGSFVNLDVASIAGTGDSKNGFGTHVGLGFVLGQASFKFDIEGRASFVLFEGGGDVAHFQLLASFGLPF